MKKRAVWQHLADGTKRLRVLDVEKGTNMWYNRHVNDSSPSDIVPVKDSVSVKVTRGNQQDNEIR